MISSKSNRLDPSLVDAGDLEKLVAMLSASGQPALVDEQGNRIPLPKPMYVQLLRVLRMMKEGRAIVMLPEDETFTTQAAANYLGMSRQHFVNLLESGSLPFHHVGTHRRVRFKDLLAYESERDSARRKSLDELAAEVDEACLYDSSYTGGD